MRALIRTPIRSLVTLGLIATSLATSLATAPLGAQDRVSRGYGLDADGAVKIYNLAGSIRIVGWDRDSVAVTGSIGPGGRFFGGGSRDGIKLGVEGSASGPTPNATLEIRVPATARVWVRGANTTIDVEGVIGSLDVGSVGGRVRVQGAPRELLAETMDGALEILGSPALLRAKTATGALLWRGAGTEATLSSVSGTVNLEGGPVGRVRVETVSGSVNFLSTLRPFATVTLETHSGSVLLLTPRDVPTRLTADVARLTGAGVVPAGSTPGLKRPEPRTLEFNRPKSGGSAAEIVVRSFKGELVLEVGGARR